MKRASKAPWKDCDIVLNARISAQFALTGGIAITLGVAIILTSFTSMIASPSVIGSSLILNGIIWVAVVLVTHREAKPLWGSASASVNLLTGALVISRIAISEAAVPLAIAGYFIVNAIIMVLCASGQRKHLRRWEWVALSGALSAISSVMLLRAPDLLGPLLGLNVSASGLAIFGLGLRRSKVSRHRKRT